MAKQLSYIEPTSLGRSTLTLKDGWELVTVLDVRRIGPDLRWSVVVARDVEEDDA